MIHFNGHLPAVIDVETTGFIPGYHDMIQICVLILDSDLTPNKDVMPFYMEVKPKRPHTVDHKALKVSKLNYADILKRARDPWEAADLFDMWFTKLKEDTSKRKAVLPEGRKLLPIAQNWPFDRNFVIDWLDGLCDPIDGKYFNFDTIFHPWYRDTLAVAQYLNDAYAASPTCAMPHKVPFPKSNLGYLCSQLKIRNKRAHDALQDCVATAAVYRAMVKHAGVLLCNLGISAESHPDPEKGAQDGCSDSSPQSDPSRPDAER